MKIMVCLLLMDVVLGLPMLAVGIHAQSVGDVATVALLSKVAMGVVLVNIVGVYAAWEVMRKAGPDGQ